MIKEKMKKKKTFKIRYTHKDDLIDLVLQLRRTGVGVPLAQRKLYLEVGQMLTAALEKQFNLRTFDKRGKSKAQSPPQQRQQQQQQQHRQHRPPDATLKIST